LVKHGATVVAADTRNSDVERHFSAVKGVTGMTANLADADEMPVLVQEVVDQLGSIDILVNEFPLPFKTPIKAGADNLDGLMQSRAALILSTCRAALPHLKKSPAGRIINMGFLRSCFAADARKRPGESDSGVSHRDWRIRDQRELCTTRWCHDARQPRCLSQRSGSAGSLHQSVGGESSR